MSCQTIKYFGFFCCRKCSESLCKSYEWPDTSSSQLCFQSLFITINVFSTRKNSAVLIIDQTSWKPSENTVPTFNQGNCFSFFNIVPSKAHCNQKFYNIGTSFNFAMFSFHFSKSRWLHVFWSRMYVVFAQKITDIPTGFEFCPELITRTRAPLHFQTAIPKWGETIACQPTLSSRLWPSWWSEMRPGSCFQMDWVGKMTVLVRNS